MGAAVMWLAGFLALVLFVAAWEYPCDALVRPW
jgi:hypothetical protein